MFYIRADANGTIATGHVMRCMSIADELNKLGEQVTFLTADHCADALIQSRGYNTVCLDSSWDDLEKELETLIPFIMDQKIDKLLVDSYYATNEYLTELAKHVKVIYMDDLGIVDAPVAMLINYNIYGEDLDYSYLVKGYGTTLLLGPNYVPLREEFQHVSSPYRENVEKVFISTGGTDCFNIAVELLRQLIQWEHFNSIEFHVISGSMNPHLEELRELENANKNIVIHSNVTNMAEIMSQCDIAISACGSTMYELCACGVPILTFSFADNQIKGVEAFAKKGLAVNCGGYKEKKLSLINEIERELVFLVENPKERKNMVKKQKLLVNNNGVKKMVNYMLEKM